MLIKKKLYGSTDDGLIYGTHAVYATARSTATATDVALAITYVGQQLAVGDFKCLRTFLKFDTSVLAGALKAAYLTLVTISVSGLDTEFDLDVHKYTWSGALTSGTEAKYDGALASTKDVTFANTAAMFLAVPATSPALATAHINRSGNTTYALLSAEDTGNSENTGDEFIGLGTQEHPTEARRPFLTITSLLQQGRPGASRADTRKSSRPTVRFS